MRIGLDLDGVMYDFVACSRRACELAYPDRVYSRVRGVEQLGDVLRRIAVEHAPALGHTGQASAS
jgi:hypothetical protein